MVIDREGRERASISSAHSRWMVQSLILQADSQLNGQVIGFCGGRVSCVSCETVKPQERSENRDAALRRPIMMGFGHAVFGGQCSSQGPKGETHAHRQPPAPRALCQVQSRCSIDSSPRSEHFLIPGFIFFGSD